MVRLFPVHRGQGSESYYEYVADGSADPPPPQTPPASTPLSPPQESPPFVAPSPEALLRDYEAASQLRQRSLAPASLSLAPPVPPPWVAASTPPPPLQHEQQQHLSLSPRHARGAGSPPAGAYVGDGGRQTAASFSVRYFSAPGGGGGGGGAAPADEVVRRTLKPHTAHAHDYNTLFHRHASPAPAADRGDGRARGLNEIIPPPPPGASRRDPALNVALAAHPAVLHDGAAAAAYETDAEEEEAAATLRASMQRAEDEGAVLRWRAAQHEQRRQLEAPVRAHPLARASDGRLPARVAAPVPTERRRTHASTVRPCQPSGLRLSELARLKPHLAPEYLLLDAEAVERTFFCRVEDMVFEEMVARAALVFACVRKRGSRVARVLDPLHQHMKARVRADREESRDRAAAMRALHERYYEPTITVAVNEVHSQVLGLEDVRERWAKELGVAQ